MNTYDSNPIISKMGVLLPLSEPRNEQNLAAKAGKEIVKWNTLSGFGNVLLNNFPHPELFFRWLGLFLSFKRAY